MSPGEGLVSLMSLELRMSPERVLLAWCLWRSECLQIGSCQLDVFRDKNVSREGLVSLVSLEIRMSPERVLLAWCLWRSESLQGESCQLGVFGTQNVSRRQSCRLGVFGDQNVPKECLVSLVSLEIRMSPERDLSACCL